jgi:chromosome segregation ATPase
MENGLVETQLCALDGCDNPLPPPSVDENGRRKGGRPSSYCCKGHADAASRARRGAQTAAVVDPLMEMRRGIEALGPVTQPLLDAIAELQGRLGEAERGAVAQVRQTEEDARAARTEAEDALRRADQAERARDRALIQARDDRAARAEAEKLADKAVADADREKREAWVKVAEHERAKGAAEAARHAAEQARDELAENVRAARAQLEDLHTARAELAQDLERTGAELRERTTELAVLAERLAAARAHLTAAERSVEHAHRETADARDAADKQRAERDQALARAAEEHTVRRVAEARVDSLETTLAATRSELAQLRELRAEEAARAAEESAGSGTDGPIRPPGEDELPA